MAIVRASLKLVMTTLYAHSNFGAVNKAKQAV